MRHAVTLIERDLIIVGPFVNAHLLAGDGNLWRRPDIDVLAAAEAIDRDRSFAAVRHRPDDILRSERSIAAEENLRIGGRHGLWIDLRHVPLVELNAAIAFDPRKRIFLADGDQDIIAWNMLVGLAGRHQIATPLGIAHRFHLLKHHASELAAVVGEFLGHEEIENWNVLVHRILLLPGGCFHFLEAGTNDHLHVLATEPARRAAAVHCRIAAAKNDDALADRGDVAERNARQPIDADVDVFGSFLAAWNIEIAAAWRAAADKDGVVILGEQRLHAVDALIADKLDAKVEDVVTFLVDDAFRQAELWNLRTHHAAGLRILIEHDALVTHRGEVSGDGERGGASAHERDS